MIMQHIIIPKFEPARLNTSEKNKHRSKCKYKHKCKKHKCKQKHKCKKTLPLLVSSTSLLLKAWKGNIALQS